MDPPGSLKGTDGTDGTQGIERIEGIEARGGTAQATGLGVKIRGEDSGLWAELTLGSTVFTRESRKEHSVETAGEEAGICVHDTIGCVADSGVCRDTNPINQIARHLN